jgi:hypothetical protein
MRCSFECMGARSIGLFLYRRTAYLFINESNITRYWIAQEFAGAHECQSLPPAAPPICKSSSRRAKRVAKGKSAPGSCCFLRTMLGRLMRVCRMRAEHPGRLSFPPSEAALRRSLAKPRSRSTHHQNQISDSQLACDTKKKIYLTSLLPKEKQSSKDVINYNNLLGLMCSALKITRGSITPKGSDI